MELKSFLTWFCMGFFGGLGFLIVSTLYRLIVKQ
jgi:hypothetical protein